MQLNVLIADDEYFIRQRLIKIIDWTGLNLKLIGEAQNGEQVLHYITHHQIDLLILDIKMPHKTGLEIAQYIYENSLSTKIIILSGYNDFEYARSTIKYGVLDYLLKPVSKELLHKTLQESFLKIKKEKKAHQQIQRYYHYEKCNFLYLVRTGKLSNQSLYEAYPELQTSQLSLFIGVFIPHHTEHYIDEIIENLRDIPVDCEYFKETDYIYTIQLFLFSEELLLTVRNRLDRFLSTTTSSIFLSFSSLFSLDEAWQPAYTVAINLLNHRYFMPTQCIIKLSDRPQTILPDVSKVRHNLISFINTKDESGFRMYLHTLLEDIRTSQSSTYMYTIITEIILTYQIYYQDLIQFDNSLASFVNAMLDEDYKLSGIEQTLTSYGLKCMTKETTPSDIVLSKRIMTYIHANYMHPDLSVAKLAETFKLNTSYIGTLFKKVNNQSLLHYITMVRMEASKKLLKQNKYKIGEISEMVGYSDVFYYSKRFKKIYGYSPKEYLQLSQLEKMP